MSISTAMLDYLAEAYRLAYYHDDSRAYVSTSALAEVMHVSAPAVTRMVQRLRDADLLEHEPYRGIRLTDRGERRALATIRRHRLVERFLTDVMGFGWHEVHEAADSMGAVVSDVVVERMAEMAGQPRRCPHGEPIPTQKGHMPRVVDYPLTEAEIGANFRVSRCNTHDEAKLKYLDSLGIHPGVTLKLLDRAPFHGPVSCEVEGEATFLGDEVAQIVRVCTAEEYELV